jgi:adenosine kinase
MNSSRVIISGSIAIDSIMVFEGHFKDHILPDKVHMLNVGFLVPQLKRQYGGTAANIAYNLHGLGGNPAVLATVGQDGEAYLKRLTQMGINTAWVKTIAHEFTAQAFITTDLADNQITAFHPGAMNSGHEAAVPSALPAAWGIVAPNGKLAMQQHAQQFHAAGVPYILDPGQGLPMFSNAELREMLKPAAALIVNDYEAQMFARTCGVSEAELATMVPTLLVTRGAEGVSVFEAGKELRLPAAPITKAVDPTGCGDAFRGGLLYGLAQGWNWAKSAKLGTLMGALKIEHAGPQNHPIHAANILARLA